MNGCISIPVSFLFSIGVVYFLKHGRVDGILLWNNYGKMKYARKVLGRKIPRDDLKNKIPL